jgi:hypothetical protein
VKKLFKYTGKMFICSWNSERIQVGIIELETGRTLNPVITNKNKAFAKFWNNSNYVKSRSKTEGEGGLYFEAEYLGSGYLRNVKFYSFEQCLELFPERMV